MRQNIARTNVGHTFLFHKKKKSQKYEQIRIWLYFEVIMMEKVNLCKSFVVTAVNLQSYNSKLKII